MRGGAAEGKQPPSSASSVAFPSSFLWFARGEASFLKGFPASLRQNEVCVRTRQALGSHRRAVFLGTFMLTVGGLPLEK